MEGARKPPRRYGAVAIRGPREAIALAGLSVCLLTGAVGAAAQEVDQTAPDSAVAIEPLTVEIGRLRAGAVPLAETPFSSQVASVDELGGESGSRLSTAIADLPGVTLTHQTGSPSQADIRVRGFALSPVVGVPQGVSVFVDGVRVNEADASQVHLSLIPSGAVERVEFVRGPVGVFGKNSIAGAINFVTRRSGDAPSLEIEVQGGSFRSTAGTVRASSPLGSFDGLLVGSYRRSEGWRLLESAEELSLFGKLGWRGDRTDAWLSYTFEADSLEGPGPLPDSWLAGAPLPPDVTAPPSDRRRLQYTGGKGDAFRPRLHFFNGRIERDLSDRVTLQADAFTRLVDFRQSNDNLSEPDALGLTDITAVGTTLQLLYRPGQDLLLSAGTEWAGNDVDIEIREHPNRNFPDLVPSTTERLHTDERNVGAFGEIWWALRPGLAVYGSIRYDHVRLPVEDRLDAEDSGTNTFSELSGGLGISGDLGRGLGAFAGYGRGFRAPVILEVTCADPEDPCQLPFELGPDPPLKPVKSDTWQIGVRMARERTQASVVGYWVEVRDEIFNVLDETTPTLGYFTNLAKTRRVGVEISAAASPIPNVPGLSVTGSFAWTRATFESSATLASPLVTEPEETGPLTPVEPFTGAEAAVHVEPGDRFPMIPQVAGRAGLRYAARSSSIEVEAGLTGSQLLVGDEGNDQQFGRVAASAVLDFRGEHRMGRSTLFADVSNVLDTEYHAFGIISENGRALDPEVERFLTPGRPRRITVGLRIAVIASD